MKEQNTHKIFPIFQISIYNISCITVGKQTHKQRAIFILFAHSGSLSSDGNLQLTDPLALWTYTSTKGVKGSNDRFHTTEYNYCENNCEVQSSLCFFAVDSNNCFLQRFIG